MANVTRIGVFGISGADFTVADADMISGMHFVHIGDGQVAVFAVAAT